MSGKRVAKWDNVKFLMILCVVLGHTLYEFIGKNTGTAKSVYLFIYTFHMPVFIFLAGMFAKHMIAGKRYDRVIEYLVIHLIMKFLDYLGRCLTALTKKEDFFSIRYLGEIREGLFMPKKGFHLFYEDGPAWFALAIALFILLTIYIQNVDRRIVLTAAMVLGCLAGLDNHLGDHLASMRLCTFYPAFLWGYYMNPKWLELTDKLVIRILSGLLLAMNMVFWLSFGDKLYPFRNFLKGKRDYMAMGMGVNGIFYRIICYGLWALLIIAVISAAPKKEYFWSWLGTRTMSVFIWHKFVLVIILKLCYGRYYIKQEIPHYYMFAACCIAVIVTVLTAYLPDFRISRWTTRAPAHLQETKI